MTRRWSHWRTGRRDATSMIAIMVYGFALGVGAMGVGEVLLALSS